MRHALLNITSVALLAGFTIPVMAQTLPVETRVDRLEKELRAVQRKVFPAGAPVQPDIITQMPTVGVSNSASPVTDLTARVDAIEKQLAALTGQSEQNSFKLKKLEDAFARFKADSEAQTSAPGAAATPALAAAAPVALTGAAAAPAPAPVKAAAASPSAKPPAAIVATEARKLAVAAVERPATGDAEDDAYTYGFRLWDAKFYPEAQVQLKNTVAKYGSSSIASRAQNLLGRAYLDDGKPALASVAFYENYQKRPSGERAADSLAYLGEALLQLKKPADACKVYSELQHVYGASLKADLKAMMDKGRVRAKCPA